MSRPAVTSNAFSRQVVRAVEQLRDLRGMTNTQLIRASGLSANYFYVRLRGEGPYNTNDLEKLADALDVDPHEILELAESPALTVGDSNRLERVDGPELARRLMVLTTSRGGLAARTFDPQELVAHARNREVEFELEDWQRLLSQTGAARISVLVLDSIADYFSIDNRYLRATRDLDIAALVEARLSLQQALIEAGATSLDRQELDGLTFDQVDVLARAVRSIPTSATAAR